MITCNISDVCIYNVHLSGSAKYNVDLTYWRGGELCEKDSCLTDAYSTLIRVDCSWVKDFEVTSN